MAAFWDERVAKELKLTEAQTAAAKKVAANLQAEIRKLRTDTQPKDGADLIGQIGKLLC
jgi:hypothetical protein